MIIVLVLDFVLLLLCYLVSVGFSAKLPLLPYVGALLLLDVEDWVGADLFLVPNLVAFVTFAVILLMNCLMSCVIVFLGVLFLASSSCSVFSVFSVLSSSSELLLSVVEVWVWANVLLVPNRVAFVTFAACPLMNFLMSCVFRFVL